MSNNGALLRLFVAGFNDGFKVTWSGDTTNYANA